MKRMIVARRKAQARVRAVLTRRARSERVQLLLCYDVDQETRLEAKWSCGM